MGTKEDLHEELANFVDDFAAPKDKQGGNLAKVLHEIFVWQEIAAVANEAMKLGWKALQADEDNGGIIDDDETLREKEGERIVASTKYYDALVKVDAPRKNFDRELFIANVTRKFNLPLARVAAIADTSKKESASPITKRIVGK